jgi:hypothetical protein
MTPMPTLTPLVAFADDCGSFPIMSCSVEQIRSKVDFIVKEPASIPPGMYFTGATGGPDEIYLRYEYENNSGGLLISQERWSGTPDQGNPRIGASAVVKDVQIGDLAGQYFKGSFIQRAGESEAKWDPNLEAETLRWVDNDISYTLEYSYTTQGPLGKEGLIAIAESLTTEPVAKLPMPATPTATTTVFVDPDLMTHKIALTERQARFKLMLPPRLPAELSSHGGARYDPTTGVASVWFTYDDVNMNGLHLNQQIVSGPDNCVLCDAVVGDNNSALLVHGPEIVGVNANLKTVQVGDVTGRYYEGVRLGSGKWEPDSKIKHLRWQVNGRAFELISVGTGLQLKDLIAIAESLTLESVAEPPLPTPEVWESADFWELSVLQAGQLAGYQLVLPTRLPQFLLLLGAHYDPQGNIVSVFYKLDESLTGLNTNGLIMSQQNVSDPTDCDLCDIQIGDYNSLEGDTSYKQVVPADANLETVQIGTVAGKYIRGVWSGTDCCGWVWDSGAPVQTLRWWENGKAFELTYFGEEIQKEDMIRIAESMK